MKGVRGVRSSRLGVVYRRDLHFILCSQFIRVLKLYMLWRHCEHLDSVSRRRLLLDDLNVDIVAEIELPVSTCLFGNALLAGKGSEGR